MPTLASSFSGTKLHNAAVAAMESLSLLPLRQFEVRLEARLVKKMDKEAHHGADCEGDGG
jgi:hypothetical protein